MKGKNMGNGYKLYCGNCINSEDELEKYLNENNYINKFKNQPVFDVTTGVGWLFCSKEQLLSYNSVEKKITIYWLINDIAIEKIVSEKINDGYIISDNFQISTYYCKYCNSVESNFSFCLKKGKNIFVPKYRCVNCKKVLKKINIKWKIINNEIILFNKNEILKLKCPKCKNTYFRIGDLTKWD